MYPKDLRRHERVHQKRGSVSTLEDGTSADEVFTDASVGSFSGRSSMVSSATGPTLDDSSPDFTAFLGESSEGHPLYTLNDPVWSGTQMGKSTSDHEGSHSPGDMNLSDGEFFDVQMI